MITYEEARSISDSIYDGTDYVLEYDDVYVFLRKGQMVLGGAEGPFVVSKRDGSTTAYWSFLLEKDHDLIREYYK